MTSVSEESPGLSLQQLREQLPYVWRKSRRADLEHALFMSGDNNAEYVRRMTKVNVYPPEVRRHFVDLIDFSTPAIAAFMLEQLDEVETAQDFDLNALRIVPDSNNEINHAYTSNAGLLVTGEYPIRLLAGAARTSSHRFIAETRKYIGSIAMIQNDLFFTEIIPEPHNAASGKMKTGIITKLTEAGEELWSHVVRYHIENDCRIPL